MDANKAMCLMAIVGITVIGFIGLSASLEKKDKENNVFAAECNKTGGIAKRIDGILNCVKEAQ